MTVVGSGMFIGLRDDGSFDTTRHECLAYACLLATSQTYARPGALTRVRLAVKRIFPTLLIILFVLPTSSRKIDGSSFSLRYRRLFQEGAGASSDWAKGGIRWRIGSDVKMWDDYESRYYNLDQRVSGSGQGIDEDVAREAKRLYQWVSCFEVKSSGILS